MHVQIYILTLIVYSGLAATVSYYMYITGHENPKKLEKFQFKKGE